MAGVGNDTNNAAECGHSGRRHSTTVTNNKGNPTWLVRCVDAGNAKTHTSRAKAPLSVKSCFVPPSANQRLSDVPLGDEATTGTAQQPTSTTKETTIWHEPLSSTATATTSSKSKRTGGEGCHVHVIYGRNGCWSVGVAPIDEDKPLGGPSWEFDYALHSEGYSTQLTVAAPEATRIKLVGGGS